SARGGDVGVVLRIALRPTRPGRLQQAELVELLGELGGDLRAVAQLVERHRLDRRAERARLSPLPLLGAGRVKLLADHAQRQELVALQAKHGLKTLEVVLAEEPVAPLRAARRNEPLVLEVAHLRDRDVRELGAEPAHDLADPERTLATLGTRRGGGHAMNVIRYLPICSSSPADSTAVSMRRRFTNVPFSEPWSSTT